MGELHLDVLRDRMFREFKVEANVGAPEVSYRETITKPGSTETKYVKQSGGRGQYAHVCLEIEPNEAGKGNEIVSKIVGGSIPKEYIPACIKGIEDGLATGVVAGYPLVDVKVAITFGSYHEVDSNEMAFKICASMALKDAARKSAPILLEPIMKVVVRTPDTVLGDIIGDLNRRRGRVHPRQRCVGRPRPSPCPAGSTAWRVVEPRIGAHDQQGVRLGSQSRDAGLARDRRRRRSTGRIRRSECRRTGSGGAMVRKSPSR